MIVRKPPMGWNSWNTFGCNIDESLIKETADAMVESGMLDAGYEYLVIDDCWSKRERDPQTNKIVPDPIKFPNGMKDLSDYVHSKGLKFGMYSCDGTRTCAGYPGSFDHEYLDAKTFAEYGCDFLKYDNCFKPENADGQLLYRRMGMALRASGREILFSACNWGADNVHNWIRSTGAHMYRSTGDINDSFVSFRDISLSQIDNFVYSAPGCFNDIDMLTCGMYGKGNVAVSGCNDDEYRTEFALWCMLGAPLMLGCDIRNINDATLKLVTNPDLIRINQDEECRPVFRLTHSTAWGGYHIFGRLLSNNEFAMLYVNFSDEKRNCVGIIDSLGIPVSAGLKLSLRDVFTGEVHDNVTDHFTVDIEPHCCACYIGTVR